MRKLRVLIVDDDRRMVRTLGDILRVKGYSVEDAHTGAEALGILAGTRCDCVLTDMRMPRMNGVELYRAIQASHPGLPVVIMTAYPQDRLIRNGIEEGLIGSIPKPLDINLLLGFLSSLRKERSILIVDDDPVFRRTLGDILRVRGFAVTQIADPRSLVDRVRADSQVVLLDMKLKGSDGLKVLRKLRRHHPRLPIIIATGYREEMAPAVEAALKLEAFTCLYKPFAVEELVQALESIRREDLRQTLG